MKLIYTDLDGTLLHQDTYAWKAARPALDCLKRHKIPWVMVTSKTRAEVEFWRAQTGNRHPFVVENGGAALVPVGYFSFPVAGATRKDSYDVLEWGTKYSELVATLKAASQKSRCRVRAFHAMTAAQVARACDLSPEQAGLAKLREYDEPFRVLDLKRVGQLLARIERQGLRWTKGGRFWHITGANDKAVAVTALTQLFERAYGKVETIGLGDAINDAPFLNVVNVPVIIRSAGSKELQAAVPRAILSDQPGPSGWNAAVVKLISH